MSYLAQDAEFNGSNDWIPFSKLMQMWMKHLLWRLNSKGSKAPTIW